MPHPKKPRTWIWAVAIVVVALVFLWRGREKPDATPVGEPVVAPPTVPLPADTGIGAPAPGSGDSPAAAPAPPPEAPKTLSEQATKPLAPVQMVAPGAARGVQKGLDAIGAGIDRQNQAVEDMEP